MRVSQRISIVFLAALFLIVPFYSHTLAQPAVTTSTVIQGNAFIPQGTVIPVQLIEPPGLKNLFVGKALGFKTLEPILINGVVVVEKGFIGYALVAQHSKVAIRRDSSNAPSNLSAKVELRPHSLKTINWVEVPLTISVWANLSEVDRSNSIHDEVRELIDTQLRNDKDKYYGSSYSEQAKFFVAVDADVDLNIKMINLSREMPSVRSGM